MGQYRNYSTSLKVSASALSQIKRENMIIVNIFGYLRGIVCFREAYHGLSEGLCGVILNLI